MRESVASVMESKLGYVVCNLTQTKPVKRQVCVDMFFNTDIDMGTEYEVSVVVYPCRCTH